MCDKILSFPEAASHTCLWQNSSQIIIRDTIKPAFSVGSAISLSASSELVVAWSAAQGIPRPRTVVSVTTSILVSAPTSPISPAIGKFTPSLISRCSNWQLDFSTVAVNGNANRAWVNVTFHVQAQGLHSNTSLITAELYRQFSQSSLVVIANSLLVPGEDYAVEMRLCNFIGGCSSKTLVTSVSTTANVAPTLSILGATTIYASEMLSMTSSAYVLLCNGQRSSATLQYYWKLNLVGNSSWIPSVDSQSREKFKYSFPSHTLQPGRSYLMFLMVRDSASNLTSTASTTITVLPSELIVVISPAASTLAMKAGTMLRLNATSSYDPDDLSARLTFNWSCFSPPHSPCLLTFSSRDGVATVSADHSTANVTATIRLLVTDSRKGRNATVHVEIRVVEASKPLISLQTTSADVSYLNFDQTLILQSSVLSVFPCNGSWQASPRDQITDAGVSSSIWSSKLVPSNRVTAVSMNLPAFSLRGGMTFVFTVVCSSSSMSIAVITNNSPQAGRLSVHPDSGIALNSSFLLVTDRWIDDDFPLAYTFAFWSAVDKSYLSVRRKSEISTANAILPSGDASYDNTVNVSVIAEDCFGASSDRRAHAVKVTAFPSTQAVAFVSNLLTTQGQNMSTDELQNVLSVATALLNQVTCAAAPNCTGLNRAACQATANTCGACFKGFLATGKTGDDNTLCLSLIVVSSYNATSSTSACHSNSSCSSWQFCNIDTNRCKDQSKQCSSPSCSAHGRCVFKAPNTGKVVESCSVLSVACDAVCLCNSGFAGETCSSTTADLVAEQAMRSQLLVGLSSVMASTDSDASSLANTASSLYSVVRNQYDLSEQSSSQLASLVNSIMSQSGSLNVQVALKIASVLGPVNAALQSVSNTNSSSTSVAQVSNFSLAINAFQELLSKEQQPFDVVYDSFRVTSQSFNTVPSGGSEPMAFKVAIPLTDAERTAQSLGQASTLPSVSILPARGNSSFGNDNVFVSVVVLDQQQWKNNATALVSDVVSVRATNVEFVDITLHSNSDEQRSVIKNYTLLCMPRVRERKNFTCLDSGFTAYLQCNGTAGSYFGVCPVLMPTCSALLTVGQNVDSGKQCAAINSSAAGITCRCAISGIDGSGVVAAGLVMKYVGSDFSSPFKSASSFNSATAAGKAYIIIMMYSAIWGCASILIMRFSWSIARDKIVPQSVSSEQLENCDNGESGESEAARRAKRNLALYISALFPPAFGARSVVVNLTEEFLKHHLYFHFLFRLGSTASPRLALVKMTTVQSFLLFLLAMLYDLNYPSDDGSCVPLTTKDTCLNRKYVLDSKHSYCQWQQSGGNPWFYCSFAQPSFSFTTGMYISIMISVATCLSMEPLDYIMGLLAAPTATNSTTARGVATSAALATKQLNNIEDASYAGGRAPSSIEVDYVRAVSTRRHIPNVALTIHQTAGQHHYADQFQPLFQRREQRKLSLRTFGATNSRQVSNCALSCLSVDLFHALREEISLQRGFLEGNQLLEFDACWGLSSCGDFMAVERKGILWGTTHRVSMEKLIQDEVINVCSTTTALLCELAAASDPERGFEILQSFVRDLLGRNTAGGRIFATKAGLDCEKEIPVSSSVKIAAAAVIFALNAFFIYYTILKGYDKGLAWQADYAKAWLVQLVLDIFVFESVQCAWIHVVVPSLASQEVHRVNHLLQNMLQRIYDGTTEANEQTDQYSRIFLNSPEYLFVSHRLAAIYPELVESKLVKGYVNHLPGEVSKMWLHKLTTPGSVWGRRWAACFSKAFIISLLVQLAAFAPLHVQSLLIRVIEPLILAALTFGFVLFIHEPIYLCILGAGMMLVIGLLVRDYYVSKVAVDQLPQIEAAAGPAPISSQGVHPVVSLEAVDEVQSPAMSQQDDMLFHKLFIDADQSSSDSDSDGTLPDCLQDPSSDDSSSAEDREFQRLFGGSDDDSNCSKDSENSGALRGQGHVLEDGTCLV